MLRTCRGLMAATALSCASALAASPARADNYQVRDANGSFLTLAAKLVAGVLHPFHIFEGLNSSTGAPQAATVDNATGGLNVNLANVSAATPLPVGKATLAGSTFTTPSGTTAYASGDLIANSATAGSVTPLTFTVCRDTNGSTGIVRRARIKTVDTGFASATVRLHLYKSSPTSAVGDNGVYSTTESDWIGDVDVILDHVFSDPFEKGVGVPSQGSEISFDCNAGVQTIYGLLEARGAYTPQGAKAWTVTLEAWPN